MYINALHLNTRQMYATEYTLIIYILYFLLQY